MGTTHTIVSDEAPPVLFAIGQRVVVVEGDDRYRGRVIAIEPLRKKPYCVHLPDHDRYVRACGDQLEGEARKAKR